MLMCLKGGPLNKNPGSAGKAAVAMVTDSLETPSLCCDKVNWLNQLEIQRSARVNVTIAAPPGLIPPRLRIFG